jgi:DNA mismatch endonuclease, patch repair protein
MKKHRTQQLKTTEERSALMSKIRAKDTRPELFVRRALRANGYRFRLHVRDLPGCPDIVLSRNRTIIQVKGCFWHGHACLKGRAPRTNRHYWLPKLENNKLRDSVNERKLRRMGWRVKTLWECKLKKMDEQALRSKLAALISHPGKAVTPRHQQRP